MYLLDCVNKHIVGSEHWTCRFQYGQEHLKRKDFRTQFVRSINIPGYSWHVSVKVICFEAGLSQRLNVMVSRKRIVKWIPVAFLCFFFTTNCLSIMYLPHKDGGVPLSNLPKNTTSELAGFFFTLPFPCWASSKEAVNAIFTVLGTTRHRNGTQDYQL